MRKAGRMIFLLCVALIVCMQGLCLAADGNWVRYYQDANEIYYVDTNSIKTLEYKGRKYLEVKGRTEEKRGEDYVVWAKWHLLFDVENQKVCPLKFENKKTNSIDGIDISQMHVYGNTCPTDFIAYTFQLMEWVEQNYPSVINEIRIHNQSVPGANPAMPAKTDVTGAANATGDMTPPQYDITDSGVVKYTMRADTHDSVKAWTSPGGPDYYIVKMSDSLRAKKSEWEYTRPGDYIIAYWKYPHQQYVKHTGDTWEFSEEYNPEEEQDKELRVYKTFSYDPATDMFTFYSGDFNEMRMRVIDRNTIYVEDLLVKEGGQPENWKAEWTAVFNYVDYNSLTKPHKEYADFHNILVYMDDGIWFPDHKCEMAGSTCYQNLFSACVDMALAFKAVKGQIGELPDGYEFTEW